MSEKNRIVVQNTTQRLIVIGGAGFNGLVSGHGIGLVPGYNEVDADLWEACKSALAYNIENNILIPSEKTSKDGKIVPVALKDMDAKEQDKVIKACLDVKQLDMWRLDATLKETARIACAEQIANIAKMKA